MAKKNVRKTSAKKTTAKQPEAGTFFGNKVIKFLILVAVLAGACYLFFTNSSYFNLGMIEIIDINRATELEASSILKRYKGRNIFDIDINSLAMRIKGEYPAIKDVIVRKVLPNKLEIEIISRTPVAKLKIGSFYPVDRSGIVLSSNLRSAELPVITGFSAWGAPRSGERLKSPQLEQALLLLDNLKDTSILRDYKVTTIDISNYKNLSFYLADGIEIKIGGEEFAGRLKRLKETFANPQLDRKNIKYIDLRFKDIVIGPK